jgi:hypothetical protein
MSNSARLDVQQDVLIAEYVATGLSVPIARRLAALKLLVATPSPATDLGPEALEPSTRSTTELERSHQS